MKITQWLKRIRRVIAKLYHPDYDRCLRCHATLESYPGDELYRLCDTCASLYPEWVKKVEQVNDDAEYFRIGW